MSDLLVEILAEEIPAGVIPQARTEMLQQVAAALKAERINGTFFIHSTSRRLILIARDLPETQDDIVAETIGPPASVAFDKDGNPTRAAAGFARSQGVSVDSLLVRTTPKGEYCAARRLVQGRPTSEIVAEVLPPIVARMSFPRMMRWGSGAFLWVRPVHSVVALFDGAVVDFTLFGVETGRMTAGHRTLAPARLIIVGVPDYLQKLRASFVEPDFAVRRRQLTERADALAAEVGGRPGYDPALFDTWTHLVECPGLVRGTFDPRYMALPEEILVTTMRHHQKVLPIRDTEGLLTPHFLAVADQAGDPKGLIARGNEWVLNARFADARFFFEDDSRTSLEERVAGLGTLQFQEKLGDYLTKTTRVEQLAEDLAGLLGMPEERPEASRAARLLKADLVTGMVGEFPDLQGVVGGLYARNEGEAEEVWQAIYDQYRPATADDSVPRTDAGGIVAIADRLDTLAGFFGLGLVPTGSKDPYALRRAALGVVKILLDKAWRLDLPAALDTALALYDSLPRESAEARADLFSFLLDRLRFLLDRRGHRADEIEAVLTTECRDVVDAAERVAAVASIRNQADFAPLATAFKRVQNILAQAQDADGEPDPGKMTEDAERQLASDYMQARFLVDELVAQREYGEALQVMASLGPSLDKFFTDVLVMAPDPEVRANRIALLRSMRDQFARVARFSEIQP